MSWYPKSKEWAHGFNTGYRFAIFHHRLSTVAGYGAYLAAAFAFTVLCGADWWN